jgi:LAO/AO transport system kinase
VTDRRDLGKRVLAGDRTAIAQAITLIESSLPADREPAQLLLEQLRPHAGGAHRIGVSGVPGVGKSTLIDSLGLHLADAGRRIAVLAVDPSSQRSGGSILGDRTRMTKLSALESVFIRPTPSGGTLGGVTRATRETITLVEAAGYDLVLVETVGVGQSEYVVANLVDTFLFLALARTGDSLQGIKRGILELADLIVVNKADGDHIADSRHAAVELRAALRLLRESDTSWQPPVLTCSAQTGDGIGDLAEKLESHWHHLQADGHLERKRRLQGVEWTRDLVRERLLRRLEDPAVAATVKDAEARVRAGELRPDQAADIIVAATQTRVTKGFSASNP